MKYYDFEKAQKIIESETNVKSAELGMEGDWYWTTDEVYSEGKYLNEDDEVIRNLNKRRLVAGINGSRWASPMLRVHYQDDKMKDFYCYKEDK